MRPDDALFGEGVVVVVQQELDHELDDLARGEVLTGGLVGGFGEAADELLEHEAHLDVADGLRVEVDRGEVLGDVVEQVRAVQLLERLVELEALEDVPGVLREALDVVEDVRLDVGGVIQELGEVELGGVEEAVARGLLQEGVQRDVQVLLGLCFLQDGVLGGVQDAVQAAEDGEREDHRAVLRRFVGAPQNIRDAPHQVGVVVAGHCSHFPCCGQWGVLAVAACRRRASPLPCSVHRSRTYLLCIVWGGRTFSDEGLRRSGAEMVAGSREWDASWRNGPKRAHENGRTLGPRPVKPCRRSDLDQSAVSMVTAWSR